ncbi:hypothetical protein O181_033353 [Austropuccinia psidii MF-1]|uniref:Uncharacterized protein n=1 Tax=Austropuccinia psidii MF-1 TaxID=1389203 RepID=A0A9Q3D1C8_9BASI|nr:hypothetical protein [Austropuccinia psidii MF-1]
MLLNWIRIEWSIPLEGFVIVGVIERDLFYSASDHQHRHPFLEFVPNQTQAHTRSLDPRLSGSLASSNSSLTPHRINSVTLHLVCSSDTTIVLVCNPNLSHRSTVVEQGLSPAVGVEFPSFASCHFLLTIFLSYPSSL